MRFSIACMLVALTPIAASAAPPSKSPKLEARTIVGPKACLRKFQYAASGQAKFFGHPSQFPPADLHHAVDRRVDNCPVPAIVRKNVGP